MCFSIIPLFAWKKKKEVEVHCCKNVIYACLNTKFIHRQLLLDEAKEGKKREKKE